MDTNMRKLICTTIFLLLTSVVYAAVPTRVNTYTAGETIVASEVTANEDAMFNYLTAGVEIYADGTIVNADLNASANVQSDKLNLTSIVQGVNITSSGSLANAGIMTQSGAATLSGATAISGALTVSDSATFAGITIADLGTVTTSILTTSDINGGTLDGVNIGTTSATGEIIVNDASDSADGLGSQGTSGQFLQSAGTGVNPTWAAVTNTSNVIFQYVGAIETVSSGGEMQAATLTDTSDIEEYRYIRNEGTTERTILTSKWKKIVGVNTATVYGEIWTDDSSGTPTLKVDIGGENNSGAGAGGIITPTWINFDVDVSGLSDGTVYDVSIILDNADNSNFSYISNLVIFGS